MLVGPAQVPPLKAAEHLMSSQDQAQSAKLSCIASHTFRGHLSPLKWAKLCWQLRCLKVMHVSDGIRPVQDSPCNRNILCAAFNKELLILSAISMPGVVQSCNRSRITLC